MDLKPYGAFIENTMRPLLEEFGDILAELQRQGISVNEKNITELTKKVAWFHLRATIINAIRDIIIAIIIAGVLWKIYPFASR